MMNPAPALQGPKPVAKPPALRYPPDVIARMKATGIDPVAAETRLAALPRDQAETTWANVTDTYRHNTDLSSKVAAYQGADSNYQQTRMRQAPNAAWTPFDDMGAQFKNSFVDLAQGVTDLVPSTVDIGMSLLSNPADDSWYRKWDDATDKYFSSAKYYVSPEAQAAVWDDKTGLNWRAVSGMMGSTAGFLTTTMLPFIGVLGRAGKLAEGVSAASAAMRVLTDPRIQAGAIGYMQTLPGYKESALQAGFSRNQAALIAPVLSASQAILEFVGGDFLMKGASKLSANEAGSVVRQLGKEAATDAFKNIAGKGLTEDTFREVINLTGKGFFTRLKQPEVWQAIWNNIKTGAVPEIGEELVQGAAESAIQKMADIHYGYGAQGGKGFDPTIKDALIQMGVGGFMGGVVGGSMGAMFGRTPTSVGQQTIWGKLDTDVRTMLGQGGDPSQEKGTLALYRLAERQLKEGKLSDQEYQRAVAGMDDMVRVSQKLAKTSSDAPTRFALFNLDNQQQQWGQRLQTEVQAPMQRLTELADERAEGQWFPKPGLSTLDQAEAHDLINQNLPYKAELATKINETISASVAGLMNPQTRQQTLKAYKPTLDALADQWENGPTVEPKPAGPDRFSEAELPDLTRTMDTPDGRFALSNGPDGRQVLRVETAIDGTQSDVSEDTDPTVGRFKGYKLPTKGQPSVSLHTIADQTRHDELLDAFDRNADVTEPYSDWRSRLSDQYRDNDLDGLRLAEAAYQKEAGSLPGDAPDWQRQDVARKGQWLKAAMASRASDPGEGRYGWADWAENYLPDQLAQSGITREQLADLPVGLQSDVIGALQAGDYQQAINLINQTNEPVPTTGQPDEVSDQYAAATERGRAIAASTAATPDLLSGPAVLDQIEQAALSGDITADTEQQFVDRLEQTTRSLDEASAANASLDPVQSGQYDSTQTGTSEPEQAGSGASAESVLDGPSGDASLAAPDAPSPDVVSRPEKRTGTGEPSVIERQPQDLTEAILQYFASGGRMRESDVSRYGDKNWTKGAKGGNPLRPYLAGDTKAPDIDTLARSIVEEGLGVPYDSVDSQQVIQSIVDALSTFPQNPPKAQLIAHQQAQIQAINEQNDQVVAEATAKTPLETLEPLMAAMDRSDMPTGIQDQVMNIIAENYVSADGLDWVGVVHLLRANGLFERFDDLHNSLLPFMDEVTRAIPTTNEEYNTEMQARLGEVRSDVMSANWWNELGDSQALTNEQYNSLLTEFYGEPATTADPIAGNNQIDSAQEGDGLPGQGDNPSGESGNPAAKNRPEPEVIPLSPEQQERVDAAIAQVDADIFRIESQNRSLQTQADKLRKELRTRTQTGDVFAESAQPVASELVSDEVYRAFKADPAGYALSETLKQSIGQRIATGSADLRDTTINQNRASEIAPYIERARRTGRPAPIGQQTGIDAESAAKQKLADLDAQMQANTDRIANLEASKGRAAEIARLAPQQASLFVNEPETSYTSSPNEILPLDESDPHYDPHLTTSYGSPSVFRETIQALYMGLKNQVLVQSLYQTLRGGDADNRGLSGLREAIRPRTVADRLQERGFISYAGQRIESTDDIVDLFQIHRSPLIEKSHIVLIKDGAIVANVAITAGLPEQTSFGSVSYLQKLISGYQADGYYLLHNHPSGNHLPSPQDIQTTAQYAASIETPMLGSVIIDTTKYTVIDSSGAAVESEYRNQPEVLYSERININGDNANANMFAVARAVMKDRAYPHVLIGLDSVLGVAGYDVLATADDLDARSQSLANATGARSFVLVSAKATGLTQPVLPNNFLDHIIVDEKNQAESPGFSKNSIPKRLTYTVNGTWGSEQTQDFSNLPIQEGNNTPLIANEPSATYGPPPTPLDQPARPIQNQGAQALSDLATSFKKNSPDRTALLSQSPADLADFFRTTFEPMIRDILAHAPNTPVAGQLLKIRASGQSLVDAATGEINPGALQALATELVKKKPKGSAETGRLRDLLWDGSESQQPDVLTAYKTTLTERAIIDEDGNYEWPDLQEEASDSSAAIQALTEASGDPAGVRMLKGLMTSKFLGNVLNPETVGKLLSLGEGSALHRITKDIRRVWVSRAAEVRLRRGHLINKLSEGLVGLSRFATPSGKVGDIGKVKTYALSGWENGKATTLDLPIGDWMDLYFTVRTQLATTGRLDPAKATSSVLADVSSTGQLQPTRTGLNAGNQLQTGSYGYQYNAPGQEQPRTLLIDKQTYVSLESQLRAEHGDLMDTVEQLFADPVARQYLAGLYQVENGTEFPLETDYFPTMAWRSAAERDVVPTGGTLLENARILRERKTPPLKVVGRDILARVNGYVSMEHRYIANSATRLNLTRWRQRNAESLDKAPKWLTEYIQNLETDLNDGGANSPDEKSFEFEVRGVDLGLRAFMSRFSRSTFAFSLTTPLKQLLTHLNSYGMGIIDSQYLRQAATDLGKLAVDSYSIAKQGADVSLLGTTLKEKPYLDDMAANPYLATILDRLIGVDEAYLGRPSLEELKQNPTDAGIALARKATHTVADYGLGWVRRADRATIISFYQAAKYQVADKMGNIDSDASLREIARLTEELTYATNTMSGEGESTPLQRNKGLAGAMLGLYSGQQQRLANTVVQALNDYLKARSIGDPSADELRGKAAWAATNLILFNAIGVAIINALYRQITGLWDDKKKDEDVLASIAMDTGRGLLGTIPSVPTEILIAASSWVDGPKWSEDILSFAPSTAFQETVEGMVAAKDYLMAEDEATKQKRWNTMSYGLADGSTKLLGIPSQIPRLLQKMTKSEPVKESDISNF